METVCAKMKNKPTCVITGANSGIGKATALRLAKAGARVVLACRNESRGKAACDYIWKNVTDPSIDLMIVDLSSMSSIIGFADELKQKIPCLDVLIHNAANFDHSLNRITFTRDGFETIFATNYLGPFLLTLALMPILKKSINARLITVGSRGIELYPFTDLDLNDLNMKNKKFSVAKAYYNSKLASVMYTLELAERLPPNITVNCVRVTNVKLSADRFNHLPWYYRYAYRAIKKPFAIQPEEMAKTYEFLALSPEMLGKTGLYYDEKQRAVTVPKKADNSEFRHQLWHKTESILKSFLDKEALLIGRTMS
ncbi:MAG: SDR family NAD(P)-dependent oxidoreductase [Chlamydiales bacterium]